MSDQTPGDDNVVYLETPFATTVRNAEQANAARAAKAKEVPIVGGPLAARVALAMEAAAAAYLNMAGCYDAKERGTAINCAAAMVVGNLLYFNGKRLPFDQFVNMAIFAEAVRLHILRRELIDQEAE